MKKLNRFVSLGMVLAMLLCLLVPSASALNISSDESNTTNLSSYKDDNGFWTKLPFDKVLEVATSTAIPSNTTFTFSMTPVEVTDGTTVNGKNVNDGVDLTTSEVTYTFTDADKTANDDDTTSSADTNTGITTITQTLTFTLPDVSNLATGIYRYEVKEIIPDGNDKLSYVTYDTTDKYTVDLYVTSKTLEDGSMVKGISYIVASNLGKDNDKDNIVFTNKIATSSLRIEKAVTGNGATGDEEFTFFIKIPKIGSSLNLTGDQSFTAKRYATVNGEAVQQGTDITINVDGDSGTISISGDATNGYTADAGTQFKLKADEWLVVENVPIGMIFDVAEVDYSDDGFTTTFTYAGKNAAGETISADASEGDNTRNASGKIGAGTNVLTYTNTKHFSPATGINLDVLPYVVVLAIALGGCVLFIFSKKRRTVR
jgi:hypothetical protein